MPLGGTFTNCVSVSQGQNAGTPGDPNAANNTNICTTLSVSTPPPTTGSITIVKDAQPNDAQDFTFTSNQASIAPFPLDDDSDGTLSNQRVFSGLPAGTFIFTETQVPGWTLSTIACSPSTGSTVNLSTGAATINLTAGANVICTFTNTKNPVNTGTLTIVKDAQPNDVQSFAFATVGAGLTSFVLDDDGNNSNALSNTITFSNLAAGIPFTVTEAAVSGWTVPSIQCLVAVPGLTTTFTDQLNRTFTVNLEAGANVTCTFINVKTAVNTGKICGVKFNDLAGDGFQHAGDLGLSNWQISLGTAVSPPVLTGSKGEYCFNNLPAGTYTVTEIPQAPWQQTFPGSPGSHVVTLTAGQTISGINFGNTLPAGMCNSLSGSSFSLLSNGNFDNDVLVSAGNFNFFDQSLVSAWSTTAADGLIEVRGDGHGGVLAHSGNQFIELNGTVGATVYQNFTATPGSTVTISFAHRGRAGFGNQMSVSIRPVSGIPVVLGTFTAVTSGWTVNNINYTFPANGVTAYVLNFTSSDTSAGGNFLDAISMIDQACHTALVYTDLPTLVDATLFDYLADVYPHIFKGRATAGQSQQYNYRFYPESGNYLAIDTSGMVFMTGPFTNDVITSLGSANSFQRAVTDWKAGPIPTTNVFTYAETNFPAIFKGLGTAGQFAQYNYRYYADSGNYLAVDNAGMIFIIGPYTGNVLTAVGLVESLRSVLPR